MPRAAKLSLLFILCILCSGPLFSQDGGEAPGAGESGQPAQVDETALTFGEQGETETADPVNGSSVWTYVSAVLVLGLVVAAIYILFYFLKKASSVTFRENDDIKIIATRSLSNTKQLHIIEIGNEYSLIGAGENGITHLKEITDQDTLNQLRVSASREQTGTRKGFQDILSSIIPGLSKSRNKDQENSNLSNTTTQESRTFLKTQQDRLKKL